MAIVVKKTGKNYYKMHRVLTTEGKVLDISEKEMQSLHPAGGVAVSSSLATPISSASEDSIDADRDVVNTRFSYDDDNDIQEADALQREIQRRSEKEY